MPSDGDPSMNARDVYLWLTHDEASLIAMNDVNHAFESMCGLPRGYITDLIFLCSHTAASGKPSLTVHPMGVPWEPKLRDDELEKAVSAGFEAAEGHGPGSRIVNGYCSPPGRWMAQLIRAISTAMRNVNIDSDFQSDEDMAILRRFQIALEATHHGPRVDVSSCFVEIGSNPEDHCQAVAGHLWAKTLKQFFQLTPFEPIEDIASTPSSLSSSSPSSSWEAMEPEPVVVVMEMGGGHYVPKLYDMVKLSDSLALGHSLATYALTTEHQNPTWQQAVDTAVVSTRITFPVRC